MLNHTKIKLIANLRYGAGPHRVLRPLLTTNANRERWPMRRDRRATQRRDENPFNKRSSESDYPRSREYHRRRTRRAKSNE
jgi:hypothetical protein